MSSSPAAAARMAGLFVSRGPVAAAFGRYLALRPDLLGARRTGELTSIADRAKPAPPDEVRDLVARELGRPVGDLFSAFEPAALDSSLFFQWHRARLASGEAVLVKLLRPGNETRVEPDHELLAELRRGLALDRSVATGLDDAVAEFRSTLAQELDLAAEADALEDLAADRGSRRLLRVPALHRRLSTGRVLTLEDLGGATLDEWLAEAAGAPETASGEEPPTAAERLARRLCRDWLRLALLGDLFPLAPWGRNLLVLPGGRPAFAGGPFHRPSRDAQAHLLAYLGAVADERPEQAAEALLDEMRTEPPERARELRFRLRHAVPFRDAGGDGDDGLAGTLLVHWRAATELGYRAQPAALRFLATLLALARQARRLSTDRDPLLPALQEVRLWAALDEARRSVADGEWTETLGRQASALMELPAKLDRALDLLAENGGRPAKPRHSARRQSKGESWAALAGLLLVLASLVLLVHHLGAAGPLAAWVPGAGAFAVLLVGGLALRVAGRPRGGRNRR